MGRPPASQEPCSTKRIKECGGAREDAMHALWQTAIELGAHDVRGAHEGKWRAGEALRRMCCCSDQIWAGASRLAAPRFFYCEALRRSCCSEQIWAGASCCFPAGPGRSTTFRP